jgi:hypothetical protein
MFFSNLKARAVELRARLGAAGGSVPQPWAPSGASIQGKLTSLANAAGSALAGLASRAPTLSGARDTAHAVLSAPSEAARKVERALTAKVQRAALYAVGGLCCVAFFYGLGKSLPAAILAPKHPKEGE